MKIQNFPMSNVIRIKYDSEEEKKQILKALEPLSVEVKVLKYTR